MQPLMLMLAALAQIVLINVVLSGDNALVIAMAARHLPPAQRRTAMLWGGAAAVGLRLVLTLAVAYVLMVPGVRFMGAVLLLGIACKLVQDESDVDHEGRPAPTTVWTAVFRIAAADLVMSLDNVVAVAGVSGSDPILMGIGLAISTVAILVFSQVILALMNRFKWIIYAGTGVLALTAAGMMVHDLETVRHVAGRTGAALHAPIWADWSFRLAVVGLCTTSGIWWPRRGSAVPPEPALDPTDGPETDPLLAGATGSALQPQGI